jgi:DNA end-binding protein Ku
VSFGLVNVPVKLYGATEEHDLTAHMIHAGCGGRVRLPKTCGDCGAVVGAGEIAKGYEHNKETVIITEDDLRSLKAETRHVIEVLEFVPASDIDVMMFDKPYFLGPEAGAHKAYRLLTTTLANTDQVALVQFAMRGKTRLAALRVTGKQNVLVAQTLRWPDELRDPGLIEVDDVEVKEAELELAETLVKAMANEFNPDRYRDTYQEELRELIEAVANGERPAKAEAEDVSTEEVDDLLAKLQASIGGKK